jgi:hypothetical protein
MRAWGIVQGKDADIVQGGRYHQAGPVVGGQIEGAPQSAGDVGDARLMQAARGVDHVAGARKAEDQFAQGKKMNACHGALREERATIRGSAKKKIIL